MLCGETRLVRRIIRWGGGRRPTQDGPTLCRRVQQDWFSINPVFCHYAFTKKRRSPSSPSKDASDDLTNKFSNVPKRRIIINVSGPRQLCRPGVQNLQLIPSSPSSDQFKLSPRPSPDQRSFGERLYIRRWNTAQRARLSDLYCGTGLSRSFWPPANCAVGWRWWRPPSPTPENAALVISEH